MNRRKKWEYCRLIWITEFTYSSEYVNRMEKNGHMVTPIPEPNEESDYTTRYYVVYGKRSFFSGEEEVFTDLNTEITKLGYLGWELVNVRSEAVEIRGAIEYIFKRPIL